MKYFLVIMLCLIIDANATDEKFVLESFSYSMENDALIETDLGYTHGGRISLLFFRGDTSENWLNIPFSNATKTNNFISFSYANQMFSPYDLGKIELIKDDRPYAGFSFIEIGLHQTTETESNSLTLQTGIVGPSSGMENLQKKIHAALDVPYPKGWDNQLSDEIIVELKYMHKWRMEYENIWKLNSVLVAYSGINLGNASIKSSAGALYRIGLHIPKDFGVNSINEGSFSSLPTKSKTIVNNFSSWHSYLNMSLGTNLVARDIFLDGNTFKDSHSVPKNYFNIYASLGISLRLKHFMIDFIHSYYTKEYDLRGLHKPYRGYSSALLTYNFE